MYFWQFVVSIGSPDAGLKITAVTQATSLKKK